MRTRAVFGRIMRARRHWMNGRHYGYPICCILRFMWTGIWWDTRWARRSRGLADNPWVPCEVLHWAVMRKEHGGTRPVIHTLGRRAWLPVDRACSPCTRVDVRSRTLARRRLGYAHGRRGDGVASGLH